MWQWTKAILFTSVTFAALTITTTSILIGVAKIAEDGLPKCLTPETHQDSIFRRKNVN